MQAEMSSLDEPKMKYPSIMQIHILMIPTVITVIYYQYVREDVNTEHLSMAKIMPVPL